MSGLLKFLAILVGILIVILIIGRWVLERLADSAPEIELDEVERLRKMQEGTKVIEE